MSEVKLSRDALGVILILLFLLAAGGERVQPRYRYGPALLVVGIIAYVMWTNRKEKSAALAEQPTEEEERRSRYIPVMSRNLAWSTFVQEFYSHPENKKRPLRRRDYEFDHLIPFARGGTHDPGNIRVIPRTENRSKGAKMPQEFYGDNLGK